MIGEFCPKVFALNVIRWVRGWDRVGEVVADASAWIGSSFRPILLFTAKRSRRGRFTQFIIALYFLLLRWWFCLISRPHALVLDMGANCILCGLPQVVFVTQDCENQY